MNVALNGALPHRGVGAVVVPGCDARWRYRRTRTPFGAEWGRVPERGPGPTDLCHTGRMHRLIRRMLGMQPTVAEQHRAALEHLGRCMADGWAKGLRDPRPLTAEETEDLMVYTGAVARRSFGALYDDED